MQLIFIRHASAEPDAKAPPAYQGIVALVRRYINQFQEVDVVTKAADADAFVDSELVPIDGDLWQAWLGLRMKAGAQQRGRCIDAGRAVRSVTGASGKRRSAGPAPRHGHRPLRRE